MSVSLVQVEPPALPQGPDQYSRPYQDQLNNVQRLFYNRLSNNANALLGTSGGAYLQFPHALLMSDQDQANAGTTVSNMLTFNQPVITQDIEVRSGGQLWFERPGQYLVTFTLQVSNRSNAVQEFEVWAGFNGSDYPLSNTRVDVPARKSSDIWGHAVPAITGIFTVQNPSTDYLTIKWWASSTEVFLEYYPEGVSPTRPAIPPVIMTINFISRLP
jgi:hypothetical protein